MPVCSPMKSRATYNTPITAATSANEYNAQLRAV
ncbi:MAG: hypothetical protein QOD02_3919, partial [Mycobacterium sp.]|nr:hypothetical protein [Mycobacterium sp.]